MACFVINFSSGMHAVFLVRRNIKSFLPRMIATWNNLDIRDIDKINLDTYTFKAIVIVINHISVLPLKGFANYNYNNYIIVLALV